MSSSEGGGRPPPPGFKPKTSLKRTPPTSMSTVDKFRTPSPPLHKSLMGAASEISSAVYEAVVATLSPGRTTGASLRTPGVTREGPTGDYPTGQSSKRVLSPDEFSGSTRTKRRLNPRVGDASTPQGYRTPYSSGDEEEALMLEERTDLSRATSRQLLSRANESARAISSVAGGPTSRLNKADLAIINAQLSTLMEVVAHLGLIAEAGKGEINRANTSAEVANAAWERERSRVAKVEAEVEAARAEILTVAARASEAAATAVAANNNTGPRPQTYAERVRGGGPAVVLYPAEGSNLKSSEETKKVLKTSVAPASLQIKVDRVRRVGNGGIVVQTHTEEDLKKLKEALPDTLKANDIKGRSPLVVIRDLEGKDPELESILQAIHTQNYEGSKEWPLSRMKAESRLAFRKSRLGSDRSAMVISCTPALRKVLVEKGRLYVGWEVCRVEDFTTAICCKKCHIYGHNEKRCRQEKSTCGKCGSNDHKEEECRSEKSICVTCQRFGQKGADSHTTGARDCPARIHAERRMVDTTNY